MTYTHDGTFIIHNRMKYSSLRKIVQFFIVFPPGSASADDLRSLEGALSHGLSSTADVPQLRDFLRQTLLSFDLTATRTSSNDRTSNVCSFSVDELETPFFAGGWSQRRSGASISENCWPKRNVREASAAVLRSTGYFVFLRGVISRWSDIERMDIRQLITMTIVIVCLS